MDVLSAVGRQAIDESYAGIERMVCKLAWDTTHRAPGLEFEECKAVGDLAAIKAYDTWKPDHGATFGTWVYTCVRNALANLLNDHVTHGTRNVLIDLTKLDHIPDRQPSVISRLLLSIGEDSRVVVHLLVDLPGELSGIIRIGSDRKRRVGRKMLKQYLQRAGWSVAQIVDAFREIEDALADLTKG